MSDPIDNPATHALVTRWHLCTPDGTRTMCGEAVPPGSLLRRERGIEAPNHCRQCDPSELPEAPYLAKIRARVASGPYVQRDDNMGVIEGLTSDARVLLAELDNANAYGARVRASLNRCGEIIHGAPGSGVHEVPVLVEHLKAERDSLRANLVPMCLGDCRVTGYSHPLRVDEDGLCTTCDGAVVRVGSEHDRDMVEEAIGRVEAERDEALAKLKLWESIQPPPWPVAPDSGDYHDLETVVAEVKRNVARAGDTDALRAERDELAAELAARDGLPGGLRPGWRWLSGGGVAVRDLDDGRALIVQRVWRRWLWWVRDQFRADIAHGDDGRHVDAVGAAETKARELGISVPEVPRG